MDTLVRAAIGYFVLLFTVRLLSRRPGAQMTMFDFVIVFLMGGVIILSTVGKDKSVTNCTCAVIEVGLLHRAVSYIKSRSPKFGAIVDGVPLVLRKKGESQREVLEKMRVPEDDVLAAGRSKGLRSMDEIDYAVLERNGSISVIGKDEN
jgi:uncharacterized membrane protein YcaP (DUF421 family)